MASPERLDFQRMLNPIPGEDPAGVDLRADPSPASPYRTIKSACAKARVAARKRMAGEQTAEMDWSQVLEPAKTALAGETKDLVIATWLAEALLWEHGFAGLRDGFRLIRELAERYWDRLHPLPDEEGVGNRVSELAGLNGTDREGILVDSINGMPLTEGASAGPFARWQYRKAEALEAVTDPEKRQKLADAPDAVTLEMIRKAEAETSAEFCQENLEDLKGCLEEFEKLNRLLEEKCGKDGDGQPVAPPSSMIRDALKGCLEVVAACAENKVPLGNEGGQVPGGAAPGERPSGAGDGRIRGRDEAFRSLLAVAKFFKDTEPHSPISYALERAVRWGKMPLPDLLAELISEEGTRTSVFRLVGIPEPPPPKESGG